MAAMPTKLLRSITLLLMALMSQHAAHGAASAVASRACRLRRSERDCASCETDQHHRPLENIRPFVPEGQLPEITGFSTSCQYMLAACRTDGTGSQMQAKISAWAYAQLMGLTYVHVPLSQLDHFNPEDQANATSALEQFFNLGHDEMSVSEAVQAGIKPCSTFACFDFFNEGGIACWEFVKPLLLRKYFSTSKPKTYFLYHLGLAVPPKKVRLLTIAIHIRRGDVNVHKATDGDRFNSNEYYIGVLDRIKASLPAQLAPRVYLDVVILSEGDPSDFESIVKAYPTTRLFLNSNLEQSLHTLISADIMVMARSSMSYVAAIYNDGVVVYDPYWHKQQITWLANSDSDPSLLISALNTSSIHNLIINRLKARKIPHHAHAGEVAVIAATSHAHATAAVLPSR